MKWSLKTVRNDCWKENWYILGLQFLKGIRKPIPTQRAFSDPANTFPWYWSHDYQNDENLRFSVIKITIFNFLVQTFGSSFKTPYMF